MRISLTDLRSMENPTIDLLEILSLEGQRYMARLHIDGRVLVLSDSSQTTTLFRSSWEVQNVLSAFTVRRTDVVHSSAYHEMVGMATAEIAPMRIRIQGHRT
ncbi:DUF6482 family protein [Marinobacter caseinilyticus]|uniref:DUF6482 family protein n=1 Tax=Marinobacter caseinilyticus TaxID=2692195 RepID=UPI00140CFEA9|nr:DUF6482 family protein [Marinobacter caseinilyticus]